MFAKLNKMTNLTLTYHDQIHRRKCKIESSVHQIHKRSFCLTHDKSYMFSVNKYNSVDMYG